MEFDSPLSPHKSIKKAEKYFELKVNNSKIKEQPLSRKDPAILEIGVATIFGEIFWMRIHAKRKKDKSTSISLVGRVGIRHMFLSAIVLLMTGPFLYYALTSNNFFVYIVAGFFAVLGIFSLSMPFFRIRSTRKQLVEALSSADEFTTEIEEKTVTGSISRLE